MAMRSRLAALGVDANLEDVARRLDAWDAQIAATKRKLGKPLELEHSQQSELELKPIKDWLRPSWPSRKR